MIWIPCGRPPWSEYPNKRRPAFMCGEATVIPALCIASLHAGVGIVAAVVCLLGCVPYCGGVVRGSTQPSIASWVIWTALGGVISAAYFSAGSDSSWWLTG